MDNFIWYYARNMYKSIAALEGPCWMELEQQLPKHLGRPASLRQIDKLAVACQATQLISRGGRDQALIMLVTLEKIQKAITAQLYVLKHIVLLLPVV